jgi:trans-aconitate methyltransferase
MPQAEFDQFAETYEDDLAASLAVTGEDRNFYAEKRVQWTAECVANNGLEVRSIVDFGCGDGNNTPILAQAFPDASVLGVDISSASIARACNTIRQDRISFLTTDQWTPGGDVDLVFVNGVFHHISPAERDNCLGTIRKALRPKGLLAFWENNPWNPGTRYVMSKCAFDKHAMPLSPTDASKLLRNTGFAVQRFDTMFYFPRSLSALRSFEPLLRKLPLGGQYLVLCHA